MALRVSVPLCTFNGASYLPEQLQSLVEQARQPDELVVRDDRSTDDTIRILNRFAAAAPFKVSIEINPKRLGPAKNFGQAIAACGGDIIAPCDQDDVWASEKLAKIEETFEGNPQLGVFFSDAEMCTSDGADLGYRLWNSVGLSIGQLRQIERGSAFDVILRQNVVTGATMAFASQFRPLILPIDSGWMHDGWIGLLIAACAQVHAEPLPLIRYRQHPAQNVGASRRTLFQQFQNARNMDRRVFSHQADMYQAVLHRLEDYSADKPELSAALNNPAPGHLQRLAEKIQHCRTRSAIRLGQQSRLAPSLSELFSFRYRRFSLGWKSFAQDLFL